MEPSYIWIFVCARVGWTDKSICHSWTPLTVNKKRKKKQHKNVQKKHLNQFRESKQGIKGAGVSQAVLWFFGGELSDCQTLADWAQKIPLLAK